MNIGNNISALRKEKGITQEELAKELGVSAQAVSKWENNSSCPDVSLLTDIADYFGITVDALLCSDENEIISIKTENSSKNDGHDYNYSYDYGSGNYKKNVNIKIVQQNGKENNVKIPFKFVKLGLNIGSMFGLDKNIADKISTLINGERITDKIIHT